jgi:CBS domain-containing protein
MRTKVVALPADTPLEEVRELIRPNAKDRGQHLFPIVDGDAKLVGVASRNHLLKLHEESRGAACKMPLRAIASAHPVVAFADEPLRVVVYRMVESGLTRFPVVDRNDPKSLVGMISLNDLLRARSRNLEEERARERVLRLRLPLSRSKSEEITAKITSE